MCLPIDSCFGFGAPRTDDDLGPPNKQHVPPPSRGQRNGAGHYNGNGAGGHYYNGNSYPAHRAVAGPEAGRKASNDVRAARDRHGQAATGAQEKAAAYTHAGADGALKQQPAAWNGRVAAADGQARGVAQHNHYYEPAHREDAADSYHPAATAHESPSETPGREEGVDDAEWIRASVLLPCPVFIEGVNKVKGTLV